MPAWRSRSSRPAGIGIGRQKSLIMAFPSCVCIPRPTDAGTRGDGPAGWRWMQRHADQFDGVWVWGLMHEAQAVVEAIGSRLPVALAPERTGWRGDCFQQVRVSADIKRACLRASGLVAASPAARQELEAAGYPRERIFDVAPGVPLSPPRSPRHRPMREICCPTQTPCCDWPPVHRWRFRQADWRGTAIGNSSWLPGRSWPGRRQQPDCGLRANRPGPRRLASGSRPWALAGMPS